MKPIAHFVMHHGWRVGTACGVPAGAQTPNHTTDVMTFAMMTAPDGEYRACPGCEAHLNGLGKAVNP